MHRYKRITDDGERRSGPWLTAALVFLGLLAAMGLWTGGAVQAETYRLGTGDVVQVQVWGHEDLTAVAEVGPDGTISVPLVGQVLVRGKKVPELTATLQEAFAQYVKNPQVTVGIQKFRTVTVQVLGHVNAPGYYEARSGSRVVDVIGRAGGPREGADLTEATLTRKSDAGGTDILPVNLDALLTQGDNSFNYEMADGDVVYVPEAPTAIVLGSVRAPGAYIVKKDTRVLDLLAQAGGEAPQADLEAAVLTREIGQMKREFKINLRTVMYDDNNTANMMVQPGDSLYLPEAREVVVLGEVARPGSFRVKKSTRLLDVLAMAGGATDRADSKHVTLTRGRGDAERVLTVDVDQALASEGGQENPVVQGGDVVFIPEGRRQVLVMGEVKQPGYFLLQKGDRVLDALAKAGGVTESADLTGTTLTRQTDATKQVIGLDLEALLQNGAGADNTALVGGDVIYVPEAQRQVLVLGEVRSPGYFVPKKGSRILDVVAMAGGVTEAAAMTDVTLTRQTEAGADVRPIALDKLLQQEDLTDNVPVQGGDVIVVPEARRQVLVLGEVQRPGAYPIKPGDRILDILAQAGGATAQADAVGAALIRGEGQARKTVPVDLDAILGDEAGSGNLALKAGDTLHVPEAKQVVVLGAVSNPGAYRVQSGTRLLDLLALAGGESPTADRGHVTLTRAGSDGSSTLSLDLAEALASHGAEANPVVQPGDTLFVPEGRELVVLGQVNRPGAFKVNDRMRLLDVLAQAGGATENADLTQVALSRGSGDAEETVIVDVHTQAGQEIPRQNPAVAGGDVIFVPEATRQVLVLGEVKSPGYFRPQAGSRLLDVVALAGGVTKTAALANATLTREIDGVAQVIDVNLDRLLTQNDMTQNVAVQGGDVVVIPQARRQVLVLGQVAQPGSYTMQDGDRVLDVLAAAGGPTERADTAAATLTRDQEDARVQQAVDLDTLLTDPTAEANVFLTGGDVLFVPEARREVLVLGQVRNAGYFTAKESSRLLDVLAMAGGVTDQAELTGATVTREVDGNAQVVGVNLDQLLNQNDMTQNISVQGGDVVFVPEARRQVLVLGEVTRPGSYTIRPGDRILDVLAAAGGPTEQAATGQASFTHQTSTGASETLLDLDSLYANPAAESNTRLVGGDVLFVPKARRDVLVLGQVRNPGYLTVKPGSRVLDVVAMAGGATEAAALSGATLTRNDDGKTRVTPVDLDRLLNDNDTTQNVPVQGGDVVFVPEARRQVLVLGEVARPGSYTVKPGDRILDVVAAAGGPTQKADTIATLTQHQGDVEVHREVDLDALLADPTVDANAGLAGGDVLFVPEARRDVLVLGEVKSPGYFTARQDSRLLDLLAMAGGVTDSAQLTEATLTRATGGEAKTTTVDLDRLLNQNDMTQNVGLKGGDVILVPQARRQVLVLGEVAQPGSYTVKPGDRILDVVAAAGGPTKKADTAAASFTRPRGDVQTRRTVDLDALFADPTVDANAELAGGEVLFVPEARRQVLVLGEVARPGSYTVTPGDRILDALAAAGGATERADVQAVTHTRDDGGKTVETPVDLKELYASAMSPTNKVVQGGDVIYVPTAREVVVLGQVGQPGSYFVSDGMRMAEVLALAGGALPAADLAHVNVTRRTGTHAERQVINVGDALDTGAATPAVRAGDVIFVPEAANQVLVLGEVNRPGSYPVAKGDRVLDAVAKAGGAKPLTAALNRVALTRQDVSGTVNYDIDLQQLTDNPAPDLNRLVRPGDVIVVPRTRNEVLVLGEVNRPGAYPVQPGDRILDVLARAGGTRDTADLEQVRFTPQRQEGGPLQGAAAPVTVDVRQLLVDETAKGNMPVSGGDVIFVPVASREVLILGQVRQPGAYIVKPGDTVLDVIGRAGGTTDTADTAGVTLTRKDEAGEVVLPVDIEAIYQLQSGAKDYPVKGGDVVFVPEARRQVLVLGQVNRPGAYPFKPGYKVLEAIAMAGGTRDNADLPNTTLTRNQTGGAAGDPYVLAVNLEKLYLNKDVQQNVELSGGDVLYVPEARQVLVLGQVNRPGSYVMPRGSRVLDAIATAGGVNETASLTQLTLTRSEDGLETVIPVDYQALVEGGSTADNHMVQGGDVVYIPEAQRQVLVLGEVAQPGVYTVDRDTRLMAVIGMAGGPTERAALEAVGIYRGGDPKGGTTFQMGKDRLLFEGNAQENPQVIGGDIVYVPETKKPNWTKIFSFVSGIKLFKDLLGIQW